MGESGGVGVGGAVQIEPVAVIAVGRDNVPRIMFVQPEEDALQQLIKQLPDVLGRAAKLLGPRVSAVVDRLATHGATVVAATEAIAENVTPLLTQKKDPPSR